MMMRLRSEGLEIVAVWVAVPTSFGVLALVVYLCGRPCDSDFLADMSFILSMTAVLFLQISLLLCVTLLRSATLLLCCVPQSDPVRSIVIYVLSGTRLGGFSDDSVVAHCAVVK